MEARFVEFEDANGDVSANVSNVQWVEKGTKDLKGDHCIIMFGAGHSLVVKGTVEHVTMKLVGKRSR
jgi:hypothetical protein